MCSWYHAQSRLSHQVWRARTACLSRTSARGVQAANPTSDAQAASAGLMGQVRNRQARSGATVPGPSSWCRMTPLTWVDLGLPALHAQSRSAPLAAEIDARAAAVLPKVVAWRRDIHQHPELSFSEVRTAKLVAEHLAALGLEVRNGVARTGVVGVLRGARPGPGVALRADMDGLPVTELVELPFKSTVRTQIGRAH